jgi:putative transposase
MRPAVAELTSGPPALLHHSLLLDPVGDCFDHALVESFNATLECELIDRRAWTTKAQAHLEVFYWIEAVYNRTRRHSALGYLSPVDYEATLSMTPTTSNPST